MTNSELLSAFYETAKLDTSISKELDYFQGLRIPDTAITELLYMKTYCRTNDSAISCFLERYLKDATNINAVALDKIVTYLSALDRGNSHLIKLLANIHLNCYRSEVLSNIPKFLKVDSKSSTFVDLASGADLINYFECFQSDLLYFSVDCSYFVHECLSEKARRSGISNFTSINKALESLERSDIPGNILAIRAKNVRSYVNDFPFRIQDYYSWLSWGGRLIIQEYSHANTYEMICNIYGPIIKNLSDFSHSFTLGNPANKFDVHTLEITKKPNEPVEKPCFQ